MRSGSEVAEVAPEIESVIQLPNRRYDIVGSVVLFNTPQWEIQRAIDQFLAIELATHLCVIDNSAAKIRIDCDPAKVTYYHSGTNLGYGKGHNFALRAASGKAAYNLVMNTDVTYSPEAVLELHEYLELRPMAGLAAPKLLYPDGSLQYVCRLLPTPANLFLRRFFPRSRWAQRADETYELRFWDHDSTANLPYFQGSFLMMRTGLINEIGGFDERFFLYGEDIDLCRRVHEIAETVYVPQARVVHEYRRYSNRSLRGTLIGIQNNARYFNKWGWFFDKRRGQINTRVRLALAARSSP